MPAPQRETDRPPQRGSTEQILSGLFLGSPLPMLLVDVRSRRITRVNTALNRLLGFDAGELEGRSLRELDAGDGDDVEEILLLALACGDDQPRERRWHTASGTPLRVELRAARLHGDRGTLLAVYVAEASTPTPAPADVMPPADARLLLVRKHQAVERLATGLAREFGQVLDHLTRTARGVEERLSGKEGVAADVEALLAAGERARALVRELLAFTGQEEVAVRTVSLDDVLASTEEALRDGLPHDIGLMVRPSSGAARVSADPDHLREVLMRLVDRAREAMPDGGYLVVAAEEVDVDADLAAAHPPMRPGPHAVLSVTDSGIPLDEEVQSRIFEPFFSSQELGQGSGLGLATAYGLVKRNGGTIWVASRPGMGTTFRVYLPCVTA